MLRVVRCLGVYDADGGLAGELRYVVGHLLGRAECALCDVTHSPVRRRPSWDRMVAGLPVPFDLRHRNELTDAERTGLASMGLPVVAAERSDGGYVRLLDAAALSACEGDVAAFERVLRRALDATGATGTPGTPDA
jgi:hypothetical protein